MLFSLGHVTATPRILETVSFEEMVQALNRHVLADWGELEEEDKRLNEHALIQDDGRLLSCYRSKDGVPFYVITEADRSTTTLLLPEEY